MPVWACVGGGVVSVEDVQRALAAAVHENNELRAALNRVREVVESPYLGTYWGEVMVPQPRLLAALSESTIELENRA